jgi:hypothetical protein
VARAMPNNTDERSVQCSRVAKSVTTRMAEARQKRVKLMRQPSCRG